MDILVGVLLVFAFLYRNNLPGAYHLRFLWHVSLAWFCGRRPSHVMESSEESFRVWPDDVDFNWHMNNSSYNKITDFCRYSHLIKLGFGREVKFRGANGGVYMRFKRALEPMQAYTVVTRVLGWDEKWLFVEHLFEGRDGRVKACGLCKLVLSTPKGQRVRPAIALGFLGYQTDVKQMSEAWQETSGGKEKRLGVCLPSAAASLLECEPGFGKDREPAGTARAFITEWLPRLKGQQACSAGAAGGDDSAEALEGAKAELRAQRVKQVLELQQQQQQGSSGEKID